MDALSRKNLAAYLVFFLALGAVVALYLASRQNYLLFHSLAELFSIVVACAIFVIAWNSRHIMRSNYLIFLGIAYFFVGIMDLLHTLAYTGMGVFPRRTTDLPTQLWVATRYMESISLLIAPLFIERKLKAEVTFAVYAGIFALAVGTIFYWDIFPTCYVEGVGLTTFKIVSEYVIALILVGAIIGIFIKREAFDQRVMRLLVASITLTIASELCFTLYISAYGPANAIGHILKILSFYLIYRALIHTGLEKPYTLLFRELTQSEEKFRLAFENANDAIFWADPETGAIIDCNSAAESMIGRSREEILGANHWTLHPPGSSEHYADMFQRHLKGENAVTDEGELITKEGTVVPVIISASLTTVGGKPVLQGIFHDISERKRIDQERQESELRFRQVTENVEEVFWISSPDWNEIIYISPAYEKIWGRTCASLYEEPRSWLDAVVEEDKEALRADIEKKSSGDLSEAEMPEYRIVRPDGSMRWILARAFPIMDDEGNINRIAGIAEDITERKIAEEEVRKSEMKYRQLSESLEETVRQKVAALEQAERLAAIGQMVSVVAHEIKNPLQNIRMGADALSRALTDDTDKMEILEEINYGVTLLNRIIGELSEYAKPVDLEFTSLSVGSLIDNVVKRLSHTLGKITVHKALEGEDRKILVDATKFGQTLVNVISNAVDALPDGGNIWIESRFHEFDGREVLTLSIRDDGAGIDEEELPNVYRPFFTTKTRGTGLGIPICMKIMAAHNGNLSITSVVDTGTTVEITLPSGSPADEKS